jgi:hypothetical protein
MHHHATCAARSRRLLLSSLAMALAACPQSPGLAPYPTGFAGAPFSQADLAGNWVYAAIFHGPGVSAGTSRGWERGTLYVDPGGVVNVLSSLASDGTTVSTAPSPWTIDANGFVTTPPGHYVGFNLKLGAARHLAAATGTGGGGAAALWILQRLDGSISFSGADLAGSTWAYHRLTTGTAPAWEHGLATFDTNLGLSITDRVVQDGTVLDAPTGTATVETNGKVTLSGDATWFGWLSADKHLLVATRSPIGAGPRYAIEVYVRRGQTFTLADLEARVASHAIVAAPGGAAGWSCGVYTSSATGHVEFESALSNAGQTTLPAPADVALAPDGTATVLGQPTVHATELWSKDGAVRTATTGAGVVYAMFNFNLR